MRDLTAPRVLIVEDTAQNYTILALWLGELGYAVLPRVEDRAEAKRLLREGAVDPDARIAVVIVDLRLDRSRRERGAMLDDIGASVGFACAMKAALPKLCVIVHSSQDYLEPPYVRRLLRAGVSYLVRENTNRSEHLGSALALARTGAAVYDRHVVDHFPEVVPPEDQFGLSDLQLQYIRYYLDRGNHAGLAAHLGCAPPYASEIVQKTLAKLKLDNESKLVDWAHTHPDIVWPDGRPLSSRRDPPPSDSRLEAGR